MIYTHVYDSDLAKKLRLTKPVDIREKTYQNYKNMGVTLTTPV